MRIDKVEGKDIKRMLLKRVLFRADYSPLTNPELEEIIARLKARFKDEFSSYRIEKIDNYDIQMNDVSIENKEPGLVKRGEDFTHVFLKEEEEDGDKYILKLSHQFMYLDIHPSMNYKGTKQYYNLFSDIIDELTKDSSMFSFIRVGLRKFNNFFIAAQKINGLNDIFSKDSFSLWIPNQYRVQRKVMMDSYVIDELGLNNVKEINHGRFDNGDEVYLVAFDYDIFSTENEYLQKFRDDVVGELEKLNSQVFGIFKKTMSSDFILEVLVDGTKTLSDFGILESD